MSDLNYVFCENCQYFLTKDRYKSECDYFCNCSSFVITQNNPIKRSIIYGNCLELNKYNNCIKFKLIKPPGNE